ncbi:unnamed protein product [Cunninghamella echinulata]
MVIMFLFVTFLTKNAKGDSCASCTVVTTWISDDLNGSKDTKEISNSVKKSCYSVPIDNQECKSLTDTYGDILSIFLQNDMAAEQVCEAMGHC